MARNFHPERTDPRGLQKNQRAIEELLHQLFDRADGEELFVVLAGRAGGQTILQGLTLEGGVTLNDLEVDADLLVKALGGIVGLFLDGATGRVGIGRLAPLTGAHVKGANAASLGGVADALLTLESSVASGVDVGPALTFGGQSGNSVNPYAFAAIKAAKQAATAGDYRGSLAFFTVAPNGAVLERMRLDGDGNFGVGTTSPTGKLDVRGNVALFGAGSFGGGVGVLFLADRTTGPTSNPAGGAIEYVEAGAGKARGSSGTITTRYPA